MQSPDLRLKTHCSLGHLVTWPTNEEWVLHKWWTDGLHSDVLHVWVLHWCLWDLVLMATSVEVGEMSAG